MPCDEPFPQRRSALTLPQRTPLPSDTPPAPDPMLGRSSLPLWQHCAGLKMDRLARLWKVRYTAFATAAGGGADHLIRARGRLDRLAQVSHLVGAHRACLVAPGIADVGSD